ncbi:MULTISPECIES: LysE family translocator [Marinobacter]|jgi:homoserine/homoserine lactone efflux protein|uniref:LysE family translocator n=1 Tax=Marinobacter TaxID=2742 RepID=UPI000563ACE7|nr:LysE family translocator [Marinobacter salarius]WOI19616.1 LysE family translocator [Marinobacter salarius]|tara:strand:+ start:295 stop:918 length:624 start_codon:yes stop_codon:yes gene_type:complete
MTLEIWVTFVSVVFIFAIIPGPTVILVLGQAISHGKKSVMPLVSGVLLGDFVAMTLSLIGLGAVLATSATLFLILKWFGVGYLIYLGIKTWREVPEHGLSPISVPDISKVNLFKSSFLVTALNPKDIVFFVAFLPQFVNPNVAAMPQLLILMVTFLGVVSITITSFALFAGVVRYRIQNFQARKRLNKLGGGALFGAAAFTSTMQQS